MGAKMSVPGLVKSISPYLRSAMVRFPLVPCKPEQTLHAKLSNKHDVHCTEIGLFSLTLQN